MQSASWYMKRLRAMSSAEIAWRVGSALGDATERALAPLRRGTPRLSSLLENGALEVRPGFRVSDLPPGGWDGISPIDPRHEWKRRLVERADRAAQNRLDLFDQEDVDLGPAVDWNRDPKSGRKAPMHFGPWVDYRDFDSVGDCKFVWELNRHHHLVLLARAFRATGEARYADAICAQLESWLDQCPYALGINWRSPLELALRLVNWVFALDLIRESGRPGAALTARLVQSIALHVRDIARRYSRGSSANNHLIGEAVGVFVATSWLPDLRDATRRREEARRIIVAETLRQTHADGGTKEQAFGYQLFVLDMIMTAGIVARKRGEDFEPAFWERVEKMLELPAALCEGGHDAPFFGDADEGRCVDLGGPAGDPRALLSTGAALFGRADWKSLAGGWREPSFWLLGPVSRTALDALPGLPEETAIGSRAFPETGIWLLQCGRHERPDRLSVTFDCGELGMGPIAAHGHADSLSFTLRAFGIDIFVDPGTYDYFTYSAWRSYFRSTRAHNALVVDGKDQSEMLGPFLWGRRATSKLLRFEPAAKGGLVEGEHDGYARLQDPVVHRRTLELDGEWRTLIVRDRLICKGRHEVELFFHLSERCEVDSVRGGRVRIDTSAGRVDMDIDARLAIRAFSGSQRPIGGWVSRGYHRKNPAPTIVAKGVIEGETEIVTRIEVARARPRNHRRDLSGGRYDRSAW